MTQTLAPAATKPAVRPLLQFWSLQQDEIERLLAHAPGAQAPGRRRRSVRTVRVVAWLRVILHQFLSPITLILVVAALVAAAAGDVVDGSIIVGIVVCSALLGAWQEGRASDAVAALLVEVAVSVPVRRGDRDLQVLVADVLPGDRLTLAAGDVVPGDCLVLQAGDLAVDESALTGEAFPVPKSPGPPLPRETVLADRTTCLFDGTHVMSGTGTALVVLVGSDTTFGHLASALRTRADETTFATGVRRFGLLLLRVMIAMVAAILLINLLLHRSLIESLLFALALAVGITPQMLPVVVSISLAAGARRMAREQVIVKRLDVIEDLGAMSVLCTDKTGTITAGAVAVDQALDARGVDSALVLELGALNAGLQTGHPNPLDAAILARSPLPPGATLLDQVPYDFERKRLSVLTDREEGRTLITKGALDPVLGCCTSVDGHPLDAAALDDIRARGRALGLQGFRVLAVATRVLGPAEQGIDATAERGLVFAGMLAFHDPVKQSAAASIAALAALGVAVKVISGDNRDVTGSLRDQLGFSGRVVVGADLARSDEDELRHLVLENSLFAEVEPLQKIAIVRALKRTGATVGFLGDGINDAGALHAAHVGLSVQTAVDVAKEAAGIVLLTQDLGVVAVGVRLGRRTFANTLKYVRVAASSNFGNILSMVVAAALLPFLPMLPAQILLLNFLADIPNTLVSRDCVDHERVAVAGSWDMRAITRFMLVFGLTSTVFDLLTFGVLEWGLHAGATLFHTAWFVESAVTQFVAMMTLRTSRPAWRSRPDGLFLGISATVAVVTCTLPFLPIARVIGFTPVPLPLVALLVGISVVYGLTVEAVKRVVKF